MIAIRALEPGEWELFRDFRLAALKAAPGVYGTSHDEAVRRSEAQWRSTVRGPSNQSFGLFDGETLIGITSVFAWDQDPSGETAILASSFILEAYRGRGLSRRLYEARLEWIGKQAQFRRAVVGHRESNAASRRANQHFGFRPFHHAPHTWHDGATEDEIFYEMKIRD